MLPVSRLSSATSIGEALLLAAVIICALALPASAETLSLDYYFECPEIQTITMGGEVYDRVVMPNAPSGGDIGKPALPATGARILIPYGSEVAGVDIVPSERILVGSGYNIQPVAQPVLLSADPSIKTPLIPDKAVYSSSSPFPTKRFEQTGSYGFRGYQILILRLQPTEFIPSTGELYYYPRLTVTVNTIDAGKSAPLFRGFAEDEKEVITRVDNPAVASTYAEAPKRGLSNFDLLIITDPTLVGRFQPLKDYHDTTGVITDVVSTDDIGSTDPTDVRNYIRDRYLADGIEYVLIGADDNLIPAADMYAVAADSVSSDLPSDIYFACLDGTFNYDGDTLWGEATDGDGGGDVDLVAEVYVGRASVDNVTEADNFVGKTIKYLSLDDEIAEDSCYLARVVSCGEYTGYNGLAAYGAYSAEQMLDSSDADGYFTVGIPTDLYVVSELYDRDNPYGSWPPTDIANRINTGVHFINHLGHCGERLCLRILTDWLSDMLSNNDHFFVYSQGCMSGCIDYVFDDCWTEYITARDADWGAFAAIGNTRFSWGIDNSTDGPVNRYARQFWDAIFNADESKPELGRATQDSKEDNLYRISEACMRWTYYEVMLFGDPTITFKGVRDIRFEYPGGIPHAVVPDDSASFEVIVRGLGGGSPVPGSGELHYVYDDSVVHTVSMEEISANHYRAVIPPMACGDRVKFHVSAEEATDGIKYDPDPETSHSAVATTAVEVAFQDDFETDKGWAVSGDATSGHWERGIPVGGDEYAGPLVDFDRSGRCFLTGNAVGDSDVDSGSTYLESPVFDLSGTKAMIHYALWFKNGFYLIHNECMKVKVSGDSGVNWITVETIGPRLEASGRWHEHSFMVGDYVALTDQVKVRFEVSDLRSDDLVEAAIDDFSVQVYTCATAEDIDGDGVLNAEDNCPSFFNPGQTDSDSDGPGNPCDNCPQHSNPDQPDNDQDGVGDDCDNCVATPNTAQEDADADSIGDACDECTDVDQDGYGNPGYPANTCPDDNCPEVANENQSDADEDGTGDACDECTDTDGDGFGDPGFEANTCETDNCPEDYNPDQDDSNGNEIGDACDYICGDADRSKALNLLDATYLIDYIYKNGSEPDPPNSGDADGSGSINLLDVTYMINYLYKDGPEPICE